VGVKLMRHLPDACFVIAVEELDMHVLIEVPGSRSPGLGSTTNVHLQGRGNYILGGVAQSENGSD
jgi:hypothetical protein